MACSVPQAALHANCRAASYRLFYRITKNAGVKGIVGAEKLLDSLLGGHFVRFRRAIHSLLRFVDPIANLLRILFPCTVGRPNLRMSRVAFQHRPPSRSTHPG